MKKFKQILCIICVLSLLTGCGGKQNKTEKKTYRQELSEEEMSNGHASFDIVKNLRLTQMSQSQKYIRME